jgi:hypothetical protein
MQTTFRSNAFARQSLAAEADATDGKVSQEIEYMFYARVESPETLLKAASCEIQEQWGLWQDKTDKNAGSGSNRVRKTIAKPIVNGQFDNENTTTQYVMTTKLKRADGTSLEIPLESSEDGLKAFKILAESGMIKHRYLFPIAGTDLKWEVDMFVEPGESIFSTKYLPWAKIDLEVPTKDYPIPALPEGFSDMFDSKVAEPTEEQQAIIAKMKGFLSLPNPHLEEVYKDVV